MRLFFSKQGLFEIGLSIGKFCTGMDEMAVPNGAGGYIPVFRQRFIYGFKFVFFVWFVVVGIKKSVRLP
jgi:hypothetical protein